MAHTITVVLISRISTEGTQTRVAINPDTVSELASMTPESFNLDGDAPTATVQAACTKNRKEAVQPLPLDVAQALRGYLAEKVAGGLVWPGNPTAPAESWRLHAAEMIRRDLMNARESWLISNQDDSWHEQAGRSDCLAYRDAEGRYADFHALRHSYITMIGKSGVSPREHQDLARHSTYALTSRYSHTRFYDLVAAVQSLPIPTTGTSQTMAATGTDGMPLALSLARTRRNRRTRADEHGLKNDREEEKEVTRKPRFVSIFP